MTRCPYCYRLVDYANHLGECVAVAAALAPESRRKNAAADPAKYRAARPCARVGCREPRHGATPYCVAHRREVVRASDAKRKAAISARKRAAWARGKAVSP